MKIKYHPAIIKDLYPEIALVIIKLNSTIISTGGGKLFLAANSISWYGIHSFFFVHTYYILLHISCTELLQLFFMLVFDSCLALSTLMSVTEYKGLSGMIILVNFRKSEGIW